MEQLNNKYSKWYYQIIDNARVRVFGSDVYVEKHHIIPDSFYLNRSRKGRKGWLLGDPQNPNNLVRLTPREHFVCHLLLTKMFNDTPSKYKTACALRSLIRSKYYIGKLTSRTYEFVKKQFGIQHSIYMTGKPSSCGMKGKKHSEQSKQKNRNSNLGKKVWNSGITVGPQPLRVCPHCNKTGGNAMTRWHFDNCKLIGDTKSITH